MEISLQRDDPFVFIVFIVLISAIIIFCSSLDTRSHNKVVACYIASWAAWRPGKGQFTVDNIDPSLCTHIIYSFAGLDNVTYTIRSLDEFLDTTDNGGKGIV